MVHRRFYDLTQRMATLIPASANLADILMGSLKTGETCLREKMRAPNKSIASHCESLPFMNLHRLCRPASILVGLLVVLCGQALAEEASEPYLARNYKMAGDDVRTRVVLHFDREPQVDWFLLRAPHRLVIDLPATEFAIEEEELAPRGLIEKVRYGRMDADRSRMIFAVDGPFAVDDLKVLKNESEPGFRLIVDITVASDAAFETAMRQRISRAPAAAAEKLPPAEVERAEDERFTVVLDAGHGGIDSGANGANGTLEKTITLVFALELREKLEEARDYEVVLTRTTDIFLRLDERVRIARQNGADLLVSIHADAIDIPTFRGATIYTLSDQASDAEAAATAARENLSDAVAGFRMDDEQKDEVTGILADLIRRETRAFSIGFARTLLGELTDTVNLVNDPLRSAGFSVLRAPDVPSVLLELGYLSNPDDEEMLRDADWRARAAENIVRAIDLFAAEKAGG